MRKIIYSPGFGAGWVTWMGGPDELKQLALTYEPMVAALERGERLSEAHPAVVQFLAEAKEKFGADHIYCGGLGSARVATVNGPVRLGEYDGSESYEEPGDYQEWL